MATSAQESKYAEKRAKVIAKLTGKGHLASFGVRQAAANDWDSDEEYVELGTAHVFPLEWNEKFSSDIQADDLMFIATDETDISACKVMLNGGTQYRVMKVQRFEPDLLNNIYQEVQVRR